MNRPLKKSWVSGPAVRKLFPDGEQQSIDALTAVWDEVVDRIISEMMTLGEANSVELHINIREDMVMGLVQLQSWLAERVVERHCHVNRVGPQRPAWIPFQAAALAVSHTLNHCCPN